MIFEALSGSVKKPSILIALGYGLLKKLITALLYGSDVSAFGSAATSTAILLLLGVPLKEASVLVKEYLNKTLESSDNLCDH